MEEGIATLIGMAIIISAPAVAYVGLRRVVASRLLAAAIVFWCMVLALIAMPNGDEVYIFLLAYATPPITWLMQRVMGWLPRNPTATSTTQTLATTHAQPPAQAPTQAPTQAPATIRAPLRSDAYAHDWRGNRRVAFEYMNSHGDITTRDVNAVRVDHKNGEAYLVGYCMTRRSTRTFRADRILGEVIDIKTGEVGSFDDMFI